MIEKPFLKTIAQKFLSPQYSSPPPLWMMRQAGRYLPEYRQLRQNVGSFWDLCFHLDHITEATLQPIHRFPLDAAIIFSDILVIPQALGQNVTFLPDHGPQLDPVDWDPFLKNIPFIDILDTLHPIYKGISQTQKLLPKTCALIGFAGSPWTIATYMIDLGKEKNPLEKFKESLKALQNKDFITKLINLLSSVIADHLIYQIKYGVEVIQIFDSWAALVPPAQRQEILFTPLQNIVEQVRRYNPHIPIIYFGKGISEDYSHLRTQIPNLILGLDQTTNVQWAQKELYPHSVLQGNLDPEILCQGGPLLQEKIDELLQTFSQGRYIFNLGHGILPPTPIEHVLFLIDRVKSYVPNA